MTQKSLPATLNRLQNSLTDHERKMAQATASVGVPFKYTDELTPARQKYAEVEAKIAAQAQNQQQLEEPGQQAPAQSLTERLQQLRRPTPSPSATTTVDPHRTQQWAPTPEIETRRASSMT